jgi:hypothetical protein
MSWPEARKVSVPVGEAVTPGDAAVLPGGETGAVGAAAVLAGAAAVLAVLWVLTAAGVLETGGAAELAEEVQAVNSTAIAASDAQAATCRGLGAFVIPMMSNPFNVISGSASHVTYTTLTAPPWLNQVGAGLLPRSVRNKYQRRDR